MAERTITELEAKIAEQRAYIDLLVKAGKGSEAEADRLKAALTRLQMGPDALTQAGLKIVIDALYTGERAALATPQQEQVEEALEKRLAAAEEAATARERCSCGLRDPDHPKQHGDCHPVAVQPDRQSVPDQFPEQVEDDGWPAEIWVALEDGDVAEINWGDEEPPPDSRRYVPATEPSSGGEGS